VIAPLALTVEARRAGTPDGVTPQAPPRAGRASTWDSRCSAACCRT
jgi:hypothetical protein